MAFGCGVLRRLELYLTVSDGRGNPLSGAAILIYDVNKAQVFNGSTEQDGKVKTVLTELHVYNTQKGVEKQRRSPYTLNIEKPGCRVLSPVTIDVAEPITKSIATPCN